MFTVGAVLVAELRLGALVDEVLPLPERRWLVRTRANGLIVVDGKLSEVWRAQLPDGRLGAAAVADDLSLVAVARGGHIVLLDGAGRRLGTIPSAAGRSMAFTADGGSLWAVVSASGPEERAVEARANELWLVDVATLAVLDRRQVPAAEACRLFRHPDGVTVGLSLLAEDGASIGWAVADRGRVALRVGPWRDRELIDVHPAGGEYLARMHGRHAMRSSPCRGELSRHRVRDDRPLDRLASSVMWPDDPWGGDGGYLADDLILASAVETGRHLLVGTAPMRLVGEVTYPGHGVFAPYPMHQSGRAVWLTGGGEYHRGLQAWMLPPAAGEQLRLPLG